MALNEPPLSENSAGGVIETIAISKPQRNSRTDGNHEGKKGPKRPKGKANQPEKLEDAAFQRTRPKQ